MGSELYKYKTSFRFEGRRVYVYADTLIELGERKAQKLEELKHGRNVVSGDMTLRQWAEKCVDTYKTNQNPVTRKKFIQRMNGSILNEIGNMTLKRVKPLHCQRVLNLQAGKSPTQINEVCNTLKFLFSHAYTNHLIATDPTTDLVKPKAKKREHRRALTAVERKYFIQVGKTDRRYYLYLLMIFCGCRPSEAAECMGRDLMQKNGVKFLHIRGTKTANADRNVPIPAELWELVKETRPYDYIACTQTGGKIDERARRRIWKSYCRQINLAMGCKVYRNELIPPFPLAPDLVPYCLRHEYCTDLARNGVDIRIAQKLMGHSDIKLTANIYTNLNHDDLASIAAQIPGCGSPRKAASTEEAL